MRHLLALSLLLAACTPPPPEVAAGKPPLSRAAAPVAHEKAAAPYAGEPGTCQLEGLAIPLYSGRDPRWGSPTAPVALVVFSDFECPYCNRHRHTLDALKARYGEARLQIVWKNHPLRMHPNARPAADVGQAVFEAAGAEAFWRYHDLVFSNRKSLSSDVLPLIAAEAGVPQERLQQALGSPSVAAKIEEDLALGRAIGLNGTPLSLLNGLPLEGAQDVETFIGAIEEELQAASNPSPNHACDRMRVSWAPN